MSRFKGLSKKTTALIMAMIIVGTTIGTDTFALATEDNACGSFVDEHTYVDGVLSAEDGPDGYCDNCGLTEELHHAAEEVVQEENIEEQSVASEGDESQSSEENLSVESQDTEEQDAADQDAESQETEEAASDTNTTTEETHTDANADGICDNCGATIAASSDSDTEAAEESNECQTHTYTYKIIEENPSKGHIATCSVCGYETSAEHTFDEAGVCVKCGYDASAEIQLADEDTAVFSFEKNTSAGYIGQVPEAYGSYAVIENAFMKVKSDSITGSLTLSAAVYKIGESLDTNSSHWTKLGAGSTTVTKTDSSETWIQAQMDITYSGDKYLSKGDYYAVIVTNTSKDFMASAGLDSQASYNDKTCNLEGTSTYTSSGSSTYTRLASSDGLVASNIRFSDTTDDSAAIDTITAASANKYTYGSSEYLYYLKDETDTLKAVLSDTSITRQISWSSSNTAVATIDASTGKFKAVGNGTTQITASYGSSSKTINVVVVSIKMSAASFEYTGSDLRPTITVDGFSCSPDYTGLDCKNVGTVNPSVVITDTKAGTTHTVDLGKVSYKITAKSIDTLDFDNTTFSNNADGTVTVTNLPSPLTRDDCEVELTSTEGSSTGIVYTYTLTGKKNFTGQATVEKTKKGASTLLSDTFEAQWIDEFANQIIYYDGKAHPVNFDDINFTYKDNGASANNIFTEDTAEITYSDNVNAGTCTVTIKMKSSSADSFTGSLSLEFGILKASLSDVEINWKEGITYTHTGNPIVPASGDFTLILGDDCTLKTTDYSYTCTNNVNIGTATMTITATEEGNFEDEAEFTYPIVASFINDTTVTYMKSSSLSYIAKNGESLGYSTEYTGKAISLSSSNITVKTGNKKNTAVTIECFDDAAGQTPVTASPGTKYVVVTSTANTDEKVVVSYEVEALDITKLTIKYVGGDKSYTGYVQKLIGADFTFNNGDVSLEENTDYTISVDNATDAGTGRWTITGMGNYTGSKSGTFTIKPAELTIDSKKANTSGYVYAAWAETSTQQYTGKEKKPEYKLTLAGVELPDSLDAYVTAVYSNNIAVTEAGNLAKLTLTGKSSNITGSAVLEFEITANNEQMTISVTGEDGAIHTANPIKSTDVTKQTFGNYTPVYAGPEGINFVPTVQVGGETLEYGSDYYYEYANTGSVKAYDADNLNVSPYLYVKGINNYYGNNAYVYFTVAPANINNASYSDENPAYGWDGSQVNLDIVITYARQTLSAGSDYEITYPMDKASAGEKTAIIKGIGNFTGEKEISYTVGSDISKAELAIYNPYTQAEELTATGTDLYSMDWANNAMPVFTLKLGDEEITPNYKAAADSDINIVYPEQDLRGGKTTLTVESTLEGKVATDGTYKAVARKEGAIDSSYNTLTYKIEGAKSAGYYGTKEFSITIKPVDISYKANAKIGYDSKSPTYTGADVEWDATIVYYYAGMDDKTKKYTLSQDGARDYTPTSNTFSMAAGESQRYSREGIGNFTGTYNGSVSMSPGIAAVHVDYNGSDNNLSNLYENQAAEKEGDTEYKVYNVTLKASDYTYYYTGAAIEPEMTVWDTSGKNQLVKGTNYTIEYKGNRTNPTLTVSEADKPYAEIKVPSNTANANYETSIIRVYYSVSTKDIDTDTTFEVTMKDLPYAAQLMDTAYITEHAADYLTVSGGGKTLSRSEKGGTGDYYIVTDLDELKAAGIADTSHIGTNTYPGTKDNNYFYIAGQGAYSGYKKVNFNIVLDLSSGIASVSLNVPADGYYTLGPDGIPTTSPQAVIKYKDISDGDGIYSRTLDFSNATVAGSRQSGSVWQPGTDNAITIAGTGLATGSVITSANFKANLNNYNKVSLKSPTTYWYTGQPIRPDVEGLDSATEATTGYLGDYTINYGSSKTEQPDGDHTNVGTRYIIIKATADSEYFISGTSKTLEFSIKYNLTLDTTVVKFVGSDGITEIDALTYDGVGYNIADYMVVSCAGKTIYNKGSFTSPDNKALFTFTPEKVTNIGSQTITLTAVGNSQYITGVNATGVFKVKGYQLTADSVSFKTGVNEYSYTGSAIEPEVVVQATLNGTTSTLKKGTDYTVKYTNNVNATKEGGEKAHVWITGLGMYATDEFNALDFTITQLDMNDSHIVIEAEDAVYTGQDALLKPDFKVYYKDDNGEKTLLKCYDGSPNSTGDYQLKSYADNTLATDYNKDAFGNPIYGKVYIKAGNSGNTKGERTISGTFTINKLNVNSLSTENSEIKISQTSSPYTGRDQDISSILSLSVYDSEGNAHQLYQDCGDTSKLYDYTVSIKQGNASLPNGKIKDVGDYQVTISGINNCQFDYTFTYSITQRSLPDLYHRYYDKNTGLWVDGLSDDKLDIRVTNVEEFTEGTAVTPAIKIVDNGVIASSKTTTDDSGNTTESDFVYKTLVEGVDYTVTAYNNTTSGTGGYSTGKWEDDTHSSPADDSPYVEITGIGNYSGSLKIPFSIGKDLSILPIGDDSMKITYTYETNDGSGVKKNTVDYGTASSVIAYTYNGQTQKPKPTVQVYNSSKKRLVTLVEGTDYTVYYTNQKDVEDDSINAGEKYVVIKGKGAYCGIVKQEYQINKKLIKSVKTWSGPFAENTKYDVNDSTASEYLTIEVTGGVSRMTEDIAKKYFGDDYADYVGYYYAVYSGKAIQPSVKVTDHKMGTYLSADKVIDAADLSVSYINDEKAYDVSASDGFSKLVVTFASNSSASDGHNYYTTGDGSSGTFTIPYIIINKDISGSDFTVWYDNSLDGPVYEYNGYTQIPDIVVTDGSTTLTKGKDYTVTVPEGDEAVVPGIKLLSVTGIGNYSGTKTSSYQIVAALNTAEVGYYTEDNILENGVKEQQYTGKAVVPEGLVLYLPAIGDQLEDYILLEGEDYQLQGQPTSSDNFETSGTVIYGALSEGFTGTKEVEYEISFDASAIEVKTGDRYKYTGMTITPDISLSVGSAEITQINYYRNNSKIDAENIMDVGIYQVEVYYSIGDKKTPNPVRGSFEIVKRSLTECLVICPQYFRYVGQKIEPTVSVMVQDTSGDETRTYTLKEGTDYTVSYGENIKGTVGNYAQITAVDGSNFTGSYTKMLTINPGRVVSLELKTTDSTSLTATWIKDIYTDGAVLQLYNLDPSTGKKGSPVGSQVKLSGSTCFYEFTGLESASNYLVEVASYINNGSGILIGDVTTATGTTDVSESSVTVRSSSTGTATVKWNTDDDVLIYKIYRATDATSRGTKVASYPVSSASYTNTGLASGTTYYYHIEGYSFVGNTLTKINESAHIAVTIK